MASLAEQLQPEAFPSRHRVFDEGEPGDRLYIVTAGKIKLGRRSPDGRENLLAIVGPSDMFGELAIFDPGPRTASATTITEVRAVSMGRGALMTWIEKRPEIAEQLFLGVNTIKTYIRSAYRKIRVDRRSQAVIWGFEHGLDPARARSAPPGGGRLCLR